jgi:hypothetical protein
VTQTSTSGANGLESLHVCGGSVRGREHRRLGRNNQDALAIARGADRIVAIVADGCSSGTHSEVGARLGARHLASLLATVELAPATLDQVAERCCGELTRFLGLLLAGLGGPEPAQQANLHDLLLFGFLAAVVTSEHYLVFGVGDGLISRDGQLTQIDPGPDNAPPYLAYRLVADLEATWPRPRVYCAGDTAALQTLLIGTDGAAALIRERRAGDQIVGLAALECDRRLTHNPSLLAKRLRLIGEQPGLLLDDTTIALVQRQGERR